tara:strand:- start:19089 stop:19550 length:462 start_codon:yes stop_codon:yes gene_type:complete
MTRLETKIPPVFVFIIAALLIWIASKYLPSIEIPDMIRWIIVLIFLLFGAVMGVSGVYSFFKNETTVNPLEPQKATSLVGSGVYKISRNPMYLALALVLIAFAVYLESLWSLLIVLLFMTYMTRFQIFPEERAMIQLFGEQYTDYMNRVRRWI